MTALAARTRSHARPISLPGRTSLSRPVRLRAHADAALHVTAAILGAVIPWFVGGAVVWALVSRAVGWMAGVG